MITFTRNTQSAYDPETDTSSTSETTITGVAIRVPGDPKRYAALGLVESDAPTLQFVPTTYGNTPEPGDTVTWANETYTVRDVEPVAPDGVTILARVIIEL